MMTGIETLLEWTDNRFGLVSLVVCMFNLYLVRGVSLKLDKCQNTDMCQVMYRNLAEKIDAQSEQLKDILQEIRELRQ